ncbi:MAG: Gfo/Idh/MocA family oxidoreductase [Chloroflexota bacterium]|nr:Gfo/Idh/MocA family oxidoreductase [Chloroflexota bacterium]
MERVRVGLIGAGGIASRHVSDLLTFDDVSIVAIADPALERAQEQATRCAAHVYADYRTMLDEEALDALYICVPPFAHGALELAAIERRLPFFVEKPLACDGPTAERIAAAVAEHDLVTAVGYHWRYLDTTEEAQALLSQQPAMLALGYWLDSTPPPTWWRHQAQSGGQMVEQTTHIFDLARVLMGEVERIYAAGARPVRPVYPDADVCAVSTATLHFASGALGTMASTCLLNWPHRIGLHLFGEGLAIELSEFEIMIDVGRGRPVRRAEGDPFLREDRAFIDAVQGKPNRIRAGYAEALKTHRLTIAANQSVQEGRIMDISDNSSPAPAQAKSTIVT